MAFVLDASVVLAVLFEEPIGNLDVGELLDGLLSSVNYSEILTRCLDRGMNSDFAERQVARLNIAVVPFGAVHARVTAGLREPTRHRGLSLGDRACLALARQEGVPVITADRQWQGLDVGVEIRLIR
ncbi:type II toxin-antitoxin system VapC family toxin [Blastomonas sp. SL216]|uniref:type II toxin-antitoxin system VapC family toxin n=1 Tax=Blastomonas sp. SL216 TaxID=2995169 RepID=UPI0023770A68|nr:type II toxin-antitoxin system VapC family toxin [Blastomonas sp. SL216]